MPSCFICDCSDVELNSFTASAGRWDRKDTILTQSDTVSVYISPVWGDMAAIQQAPDQFGNAAYACSCAWEIGNGILGIHISSNHDFNDIPAGESLNSKFSCYRSLEESAIDSCIRETLAEGVYASNLEGYMQFWLTETPIVKEHVFKVKIADHSSLTKEAFTDTLRWE